MVDKRGSSEKKLVLHLDQMVLSWAVRWEQSVELMVACLVLKTAEKKVALKDSNLDLK